MKHDRPEIRSASKIGPGKALTARPAYDSPGQRAALQPKGHFLHQTGRNMLAEVMEHRPQLIVSAAAGDADSFAVLIEPLLDPAYRLAAVMLADRSSAEDAVQEASIKAWRKLRQLRGDLNSLRPWFLSIVANECRMARRQRWWSVFKLADIPSSASSPEQSATSDLHGALLKLSPDERLPLVLHFYLDLPMDEVARALHVSPAAAKSRIYRAAKRLRSDLTVEEAF
ncbi:MAG: RNA polymerase sigma factor [Candidatus Dormibacteria bacterium]